MNPIPTSFTQRATAAGESSMATPRPSRRSAEPHFDGTGDDERRRGRDVEGPGGIASRPTGVYNDAGGRIDVNTKRVPPHRAREACNLFYSLAAHAERGHQCPDLGWSHGSRHDLVHGGRCQICIERAAFDDSPNRILDVV